MSDASPPPDASPPEGGRSLAQQALDALVYAPAGFVLTAVEDLPEMAAKGRAHIEVQLRNAHVVGRFAVGYGLKDLDRRLRRLAGERGAPSPAPAPGPAPAPEAGGPAAAPGARRPRRRVVPEHPVEPERRVVPERQVVPEQSPAPERPSPAGAPVGSLGIPDYDTLSASQVVRRLDGLGATELQAVVRHEAATRGRRTILHRAQQLLGSEDVPGR